MVLAVTVPAIVASVGQRFVQTSQGFVTFRLHRVFDVHAGPSSRHDDLVLNGVYQNGTIVSVHIVSDTIGGVAQSPDEIATAESQWEHPEPGDVFHPPYDPRFFREYAYRVNSAARTVGFKPLVNDGSHGSGSFGYDSKFNVVSYQYQPSIMPSHAKSGTVNGTRSPVLSRYWAATQELQQYTGRYALWSGGATVQYTWSAFTRYSTLLAAKRAIGK